MADTEFLNKTVHKFRNWFLETVLNVLLEQLRISEGPARVEAFFEDINALLNCLTDRTDQIDIPSGVEARLLPVLKHALSVARLEEARRIEPATTRTADAEVLKLQQKGVERLDRLLSEAWASEVKINTPRASDYLTPRALEGFRQTVDHKQIAEETFEILLSRSVFLGNLRYHRERCEIRGAPIAVAFLDIDDFKQYNTEHTEAVIDREFLRKFLTVLEAAVYYHGEAYQQGGDECVLILPNREKQALIELLFGVQTKLEATENSLEIRPRVSIGVCIVEPDCMLTEREILERANFAESQAKKEGKDCIVVCDSRSLSAPKIEIVRRPV